MTIKIQTKDTMRKVAIILSILLLTASVYSQTVKDMEDIKWIDAYYNYTIEYENYLGAGVILVDLDFDGVPEIFNIETSSGGYFVRFGLTYKNDEVTSIKIGAGITKFAGTIQDVQGKRIWYTYYSPYAPHRGVAYQRVSYYDFSALPNIVETAILSIEFEADYFNEVEPAKVSVMQFVSDNEWKEIELTPEEYASYRSWYDSDAEIGENIHLLPHLAQLEAKLNIEQQKSMEIDLRDWYYDKDEREQALNYEIFKQALLQWY